MAATVQSFTYMFSGKDTHWIQAHTLDSSFWHLALKNRNGAWFHQLSNFLSILYLGSEESLSQHEISIAFFCQCHELSLYTRAGCFFISLYFSSEVHVCIKCLTLPTLPNNNTGRQVAAVAAAVAVTNIWILTKNRALSWVPNVLLHFDFPTV